MGTKRNHIVASRRELVVDGHTPVSLYKTLSEGEIYSFLLESVEGGEKWARYSFAGWAPMRIFTFSKGRFKVTNGEGKELFSGETTDPLSLLRTQMAGIEMLDELHLPRLAGGAVGFLGYDLVRFFENLPDMQKPELEIPEFQLIIPSRLVVHDNLKHTVTLLAFEEVNGGDVTTARKIAEEKMQDMVKCLRASTHVFEPFTLMENRRKLNFHSNFEKSEFERRVAAVRDYILQGEAIQVVLSQRFELEAGVDPFNTYRALRIINPSPYMYFIKMDDLAIVGSSPEVMARVNGGVVEVRPIAGTRPRGQTESEDRAFEAELCADRKEAAEHVMLVDLGRNDVGRVARKGSVEVTEFMVVERYSHVMHLVSHVKGILEEGKDAFDVFKATFPAGTVSGAPKVRAMEIIEEMETVKRGPYAGAVGYFDLKGNMDMAITIRTLVFKGNAAYVQAGAGIVADSVPEREYEETRNKALALLKAVEMAP